MVSLLARAISLLLVFLFILISSPIKATVHEVNIGNFFFSPQKTIVQPGDTVRWTNTGGVHTTTSTPTSPKQWNSGTLGLDASYEVVFELGDGPGPFPYLCSVHPTTMKDTIFMEIPAQPTIFEFVLNGNVADECSGTGTRATGFGQFILNADSTELSILIEHDVENPIAGHVHLGAPCIGGAIQFPFSSANSPVEETWQLSPADVANLVAGDLYANIHSNDFPAEEIRGQIEQNIFVCGDANLDKSVNVGDPVFLLNFIFKNGPSPRPIIAGDPNCDATINIGDAVYLLAHIFKNGPLPCTSCE